MLYSKSLRGQQASEIPTYDPIAILRALNYFPFVNGRNKPAIADALRDDAWKRVFCDMSAAATTQLYYRDMINIEKIWETVAIFFHQAIQMRGFQPLPDLDAEIGIEDEAPMLECLVAGTQAPEIYRSRVDGCLNLLRSLCPTKCRVTFSGANPSKANLKMGLSGGVRTLNEAADMELYFRNRIQRSPLPPGVQCALQRESESESTLKNIEYFFEHIGKDLRKNKPGHIFIISSLYHLPRFIDLTLEIIDRQKLPIARLSFVSAEDPLEAMPPEVQCSDFVKSCMFEFYWQLYNHTPPETICQVGRA
ncbi:MAG: hypothetical protein AAFN74_00515 [Myxococcota bacterium]